METIRMNEEKIEIPDKYKKLYEQAREDPARFWHDVATGLESTGKIHWFKPWQRTFEWNFPSFRWFVGGTTNICYNCLDIKILNGYGNKIAFIEISGEKDTTRYLTYGQLLDLVKKYAAALRGMGIEKGDRVMLYTPLSLESAAIMLASARIGAINVPVFAGFSSNAIADRIELTRPKAAFVQNVSSRRGNPLPLKERFDKGIEISGTNIDIVVVIEDEGQNQNQRKFGLMHLSGW